ncbi:MAG: fructosamine kinase family protein [Betaproteobacteria bacterium]|nr:fructosamine kinase family protein [Betaproteobacteria bacterium]
MGLWDDVAERIAAATGKPFKEKKCAAVGGGCINVAHRLEGEAGVFFVKTNEAEKAAMFEAEAAGLDEILASRTLRAPRPVAHGVSGDTAWLALEYIEMGSGGQGALRTLGKQLAGLHRVTREEFGWDRDNTIGSTPQVNTKEKDWVSFYRSHRLEFQLRLAAAQGHRGEFQRKADRLLSDLEVFFASYRPAASLLHGDLWGGNYGFDAGGNPVVFDPAVYYGDREADLAMTELFGGFGADFYAAYREAHPLDGGYAVRRHLYNLYHVLNHLNLFGGGYRSQAEAMIERLLAEIR